jgi:hypothetical protein
LLISFDFLQRLLVDFLFFLPAHLAALTKAINVAMPTERTLAPL